MSTTIQCMESILMMHLSSLATYRRVRETITKKTAYSRFSQPNQQDENENWLKRVYPRYFAYFIKGQPPAPGYQQNLATYYEGLVKYDNALSLVNKVLSSPVHDKSHIFDGDFQSFLESLTIKDAIIFFCFAVGTICFLCCLCKCFTRICCCCCRKKRGCEHEPLLVYQFR
ncbi:hypothetical protein PENTCL1PPCAC_28159 [Pristionchus entomophagus]|uniref:Uncharacterized protein n=1 Tax=Pristionchus entomophagus TaxID=358040 RepID=A0AAV5UJD2_9BILA|nr:hypothetical protein PENTCL1PPCAC_28159 [Pristionchus entomophagus]